MSYTFRKAESTDITTIWTILQQAITKRKNEGSNQWQDGYPNLEVVKRDIENDYGYVLKDEKTILGYCAILLNYEPEYDKIEGEWLTNSDFVVIHRIAIAENYLGQALSKTLIEHIQDFAVKRNVFSIKVDTNHDNFAMLKIFEKLDFTFCGIVHFRGSPRRAYEKVLS
jgi:ribosomal protein S18 acetylase RimI-like enzyme